jgi:hypothetical protein
MSDPVTNVEIEDVLSSIRRLVAEGGRGKAMPTASDTQKDAVPDKFVLTPALRVASDNTNGPAQDETPKTDAPAVDAEGPLTLEDPVVVPDRPPAQSVHAADRADRPPHKPTDRASLEETIAELEAAVTAQGQEWEPDGSEDQPEPAFSLTRFPPLADVEDAETIDPSQTPDIAPKAEPAKDDADDHARYDEPAMFAEQDKEDTDEAPLFLRHPTNKPDLLDDDLAPYLSDDAVIDEAALREIISEVLREELQGALGERITRNVRKLVRREIQRVMSAQDLS